MTESPIRLLNISFFDNNVKHLTDLFNGLKKVIRARMVRLYKVIVEGDREIFLAELLERGDLNLKAYRSWD